MKMQRSKAIGHTAKRLSGIAARLSTTRMVILLALIIGAVYALGILGISYVLGHGAYWSEPYGDPIEHRIGALYFMQDAWRFPLFFVPKMGFPEGGNIVFTDSIPLIAPVFKAIYEMSGVLFNYFGLWVFACFPLLAACTVLAARESGIDDLIAIVGAALLALASPALLARLGHEALMGHFIIVLSVFLYFRLRQRPNSRTTAIQICVVSAAALLIHPYFLALVVPIFLAALAQSIFDRRITVARTALNIGAIAAVVVVTAWIAGIIGNGDLPQAWGGFGDYSMNALSPFLPPRERLPVDLAQRITWDIRGLSWDATSGQYEGYNYLGAGVLLLIVLHLIVSRPLLKAALKRHTFLVVLLVAFTIYALSRRIYIGNWLAVDAPVPWPLTEITGHFRASGRFFWPVYYVLIIALIYATLRRFGLPTARIVIIAAVALQLVDTQLTRNYLAAAVRHGYPDDFAADQWRTVLSNHRLLMEYPSYQCRRWRGDLESNFNYRILLAAAELNKTSNSVPLAEPPHRSCADEQAEGLKFDLQTDVLYVYRGSFPIGGIKTLPTFSSWCREYKYGVACSRNWDRMAQLADLSAFKPITHWVVPEYRLGEKLVFSAGGNGVPSLTTGWSDAEGWGIWSNGHESGILLQLPRLDGDIRLTVDARTFVHPGRPSKDVMVFINNVAVATWTFGAGLETHSVIFSSNILHGSGLLTIRFFVPVVESPAQVGLGQDTRELGLGLLDLTIDQAMAAPTSAGSLPNR